MSERITVTRETDELHRQQWVFTTFNLPAIHLEEYAEEARKTKRHKWRVEGNQVYSRLFGSRFQGLKVEPEIPQDVIDEALDAARAMIGFQVWERRTRR